MNANKKIEIKNQISTYISAIDKIWQANKKKLNLRIKKNNSPCVNHNSKSKAK